MYKQVKTCTCMKLTCAQHQHYQIITRYLYSLFERFREKIITVLYSNVILPGWIHPSSRNLKRNRKPLVLLKHMGLVIKILWSESHTACREHVCLPFYPNIKKNFVDTLLNKYCMREYMLLYIWHYFHDMLSNGKNHSTFFFGNKLHDLYTMVIFVVILN